MIGFQTNALGIISAKNIRLLSEHRLSPMQIVRNAIKGATPKLRKASELYILRHPEIHRASVKALSHFLRSEVYCSEARIRVYHLGRYIIKRDKVSKVYPERIKATKILRSLFKVADYKSRMRINNLLHNAPPLDLEDCCDFQLG